MKKSRIIIGIPLNLSLWISLLFGFIDLSSVFKIALVFQPLVVFYNYYAAVNCKQLSLLNGLLCFSNIGLTAVYAVLYKFVYKTVYHGLSWNSIANEMAFVVGIIILALIALIVIIECIISIVLKYRKE